MCRQGTCVFVCVFVTVSVFVGVKLWDSQNPGGPQRTSHCPCREGLLLTVFVLVRKVLSLSAQVRPVRPGPQSHQDWLPLHHAGQGQGRGCATCDGFRPGHEAQPIRLLPQLRELRGLLCEQQTQPDWTRKWSPSLFAWCWKLESPRGRERMGVQEGHGGCQAGDWSREGPFLQRLGA